MCVDVLQYTDILKNKILLYFFFQKLLLLIDLALDNNGMFNSFPIT